MDDLASLIADHFGGTVGTVIKPTEGKQNDNNNNKKTKRKNRERELVLNLTQGLDVRTMTPELAEKLNRVRFYGKGKGTIHYAWDLMPFEKKVLRGIRILKRFVAKSRHSCYVLVGFDTTFEEDMYRIRRLEECGVDPYIMRYHNKDRKTNHFTRWVNTHLWRNIPFSEYQPWINAQRKYGLT